MKLLSAIYSNTVIYNMQSKTAQNVTKAQLHSAQVTKCTNQRCIIDDIAKKVKKR